MKENNDKGTIRDLRKVWDDPKCMSEFGYENTISIDNDEQKVRNYKQNSIVVDTFTPEHLIYRKPNNHYYLNELGNYLIRLLDNYQGDIRQQLKETPFAVNEKEYNKIDYSLLDIAPEDDNEEIPLIKPVVFNNAK